MNASETLRHVLVPYAYEAQITVDVLNEPKTMAKIVDVDLANIPLNEIKLYTANHYVIEDRHNFTANCVTSRAKNSLNGDLRRAPCDYHQSFKTCNHEKQRFIFNSH